MSKNVLEWTKVGVKLPQIDSTNDELQRRLTEAAKNGHSIPSGFSIRADYQTHGRGQYRRNWEGAPGLNLSVSFYIADGQLCAEQSFVRSQSVSLAVRRTVEEFSTNQSCLVKWPNDVYIEGRKVGGILILNSLTGQRVSHAIVGIGINVNETNLEHLPQATSLRLEIGRSLNVDEVWSSLARNLSTYECKLQACARIGDFYEIQQEYHRYLFGFNQLARFEKLKTGEPIIGTIRGVRPDGKLRVERDDEESFFALGEIKFNGLLENC